MNEPGKPEPQDPYWWTPWAVLVALVLFGILGLLGAFGPKADRTTAADVPVSAAPATSSKPPKR